MRIQHRGHRQKILILALIFILLFAYFFLNSLSRVVRQMSVNISTNEKLAAQNTDLKDCPIDERPLAITGDSLSGVVEPGAVMKILMGYYKCQPVERDDLVVYNYPAGMPLIKIARAVEGDRFHMQKSANANCWNMLVNDVIIKTSQGKDYCFSDRGYKMLSLYEKSYKGVIPSGALLLLGNLPEGSLDSSMFGLVSNGDLLGKAVKVVR